MEKIFIIEDEESLRTSISDFLVQLGYRVSTASNGKDALREIGNYGPDLVLSDIMMPEMNGYTVLEELQKNPVTSLIPFIFLTAKIDQADIRKGMNLGADDYLTKPFRLGDLLTAVKKRLEKKKIIDEKISSITDNITKFVPHELRTPLVSISGFSDLILDDFESLMPEEIYAMVERIKNGSKRLHGTIEKFITFTEIELISKVPEHRREVSSKHVSNPYDLISTIIQLKASQAGRKDDISLKQYDVNCAVNIPQSFLNIITTELVENSLKYSETGSRIEIAFRIEDEFFEFAIKDNGIGMSEKQIAMISPFIQFNRDRLQQSGNGLGLIIVKNILDICGGSMKIDSRLNEYTCVTVTLRRV